VREIIKAKAFLRINLKDERLLLVPQRDFLDVNFSISNYPWFILRNKLIKDLNP